MPDKDPQQRCGAKTRNGGRCKLPPMTGATRCRMHGGASPQAIAAAKRRLEEQAAAAAVATYGLPVDISPTEALLEEVRWTAGHVAYLRARVQEVEQDKLIVGVTERKIDPIRGTTTTIKATAHIWLELYDRERKHLVDVCSAALRAGVEERVVRLAEREGDLIADAIARILDDLDLTSEQQARVADVVPRQLRLLAGGAA